MATFRILITGSREWNDLNLMRNALAKAREMNVEGFPMVIVHGGARGADKMAGLLARDTADASEEVHEANWRPLGYFDPMQGFVRNQKMVDLRADLAIAFYRVGAKNSGTKDCVARIQKTSIPLWEFWSEN